jgi:hypothetical protein
MVYYPPGSSRDYRYELETSVMASPVPSETHRAALRLFPGHGIKDDTSDIAMSRQVADPDGAVCSPRWLP